MAMQREKRDRLTNSEVGIPNTSKVIRCKTCKTRMSANDMCVCVVSGHPDLEGYRFTKDTRVRVSDEESTNSVDIFYISNKAANVVLALHIDTADSNGAQLTNINQPGSKTELRRSMSQPISSIQNIPAA